MKVYDNWSQYPQSEWRWPDFTPSEIACRGTGKLAVSERAMDMLQALRDRIGVPVHINSGYRSHEHNRAVGGAKNSKHMLGIAFDVRMAGHDPQAFMATAKAVGFKGIGEYPILGFCHIDARETAAHWLGSRGVAFPGVAVGPIAAPSQRPAQRPVVDQPLASNPVDVRRQPQSDRQSPLASTLAILARFFGGKKNV